MKSIFTVVLKFKIILGLSLILGLSGCLSGKRIIYLQGGNVDYNAPTSINNKTEDYRLQIHDVLFIRVLNADTDLSDVFNLQVTQRGSGNNNPLSIFLSSYIVDEQGKITIPVVGSLEVVNLTLREIEEKLASMLSKEYLNQPKVIVRLPNFMISVMGEVTSPGRFPIYQDRISLLEVLAMANDLKDFANRQRVKIIRQLGNKLEVILVDLTKTDFLTSPYYYLKPNDLVYVEPLKARIRRTNLPLLTTIFSGISATILILKYLQP